MSNDIAFKVFFKFVFYRHSDEGSRVENLGASESESESSQRSSTGKDFEIVSPEELDS